MYMSLMTEQVQPSKIVNNNNNIISNDVLIGDKTNTKSALTFLVSVFDTYMTLW